MGGPKVIATLLSLSALAVPSGAYAASTGGTSPDDGSQSQPSNSGTGGSRPSSSDTGGSQYAPEPGAPSGAEATLVNGKAYAPAGAPKPVVRAIRAGNKLQNKPYLYGGGHQSFKSPAYDCSGTVSFALHGGRLLASPLDSTSLMSWGSPGPGSWITVYANPRHTYMVIAGLRLDTSGTGGRGPRWQTAERDPSEFTARHPAGL